MRAAVPLAAAAAISGLCLAAYALAQAGPGQAGGLAGAYYNLVYATTACPRETTEAAGDENFSIEYYPVKAARGMGRNAAFQTSGAGLPKAFDKIAYRSGKTYPAGNILIQQYVPVKSATTNEQLRAFAEAYAAETVGPAPGLSDGRVPGAPFSVKFRSGPREGLIFTDASRNLYIFEDQDMAMQAGDVPFIPVFFHALGIGSYALGDYATFGVNDWLTRPSREKRAECNFREIAKTVRVKEKV